jgi:hypothetical protein
MDVLKRVNDPASFGWYQRPGGAYCRRWFTCVGVQYDIMRDCYDLWLRWPIKIRLWRNWWGLEPWHIAFFKQR